MSVDIYVVREKQTIDIFPLSNQKFIESIYIPKAEEMGLQLIPLLIRAAGLVIDHTNKEKMMEELSIMDSLVDEYVHRSKRRYVLSVNSKIRKAIAEKMTGSDISLYVG